MGEKVYKGFLHFFAKSKQEDCLGVDLQNIAWNNLRTWTSVPVLITGTEIYKTNITVVFWNRQIKIILLTLHL